MLFYFTNISLYILLIFTYDINKGGIIVISLPSVISVTKHDGLDIVHVSMCIIYLSIY
jgi:hypothetical protein